MNSPEWFQRWFGDEYKRLYPHRDGEQAAAQADAMLRAVRRAAPMHLSFSVLDIGCGAGRHLAALRAQPGPARVVGVDLSPVLLHDARTGGFAVARADMRRLPFADASFDLVASFFTSFGYFASAEEDAATLREFARVTRPGGFLFLDLPNKEVVLRGLVPAESVSLPGRRVELARAREGDVVVKRIAIFFEGAPDGEAEHHEERVRLYDLPALHPVFVRAGLEVVQVMGDEHGGGFDAATSPRMSLLLRRRAAEGIA